MDKDLTDKFLDAIRDTPPPPPAPLPDRAVSKDRPVGYFERLADKGAEGESMAQRDARRLDQRLPEGYEATTAADITFDPRVAYELALGMDKAHAIFAKYGYTEVEARQFIENALFMSAVRKYREEIVESGIGFKLRAKIQAEDLLSHSYLIATDPEAPMSVRADMIKWTAKVAGFEPSGEKGGPGGAAGGSGFTLNITFAGTPTPVAVEGRVIEGERT